MRNLSVALMLIGEVVVQENTYGAIVVVKGVVPVAAQKNVPKGSFSFMVA
jgi:hypothetical protein